MIKGIVLKDLNWKNKKKGWFISSVDKETKEVFHIKINKLYGEFLEEYITKYKDNGKINEEECFIIRRVFEFIKDNYNNNN